MKENRQDWWSPCHPSFIYLSSFNARMHTHPNIKSSNFTMTCPFLLPLPPHVPLVCPPVHSNSFIPFIHPSVHPFSSLWCSPPSAANSTLSVCRCVYRSPTSPYFQLPHPLTSPYPHLPLSFFLSFLSCLCFSKTALHISRQESRWCVRVCKWTVANSTLPPSDWQTRYSAWETYSGFSRFAHFCILLQVLLFENSYCVFCWRI